MKILILYLYNFKESRLYTSKIMSYATANVSSKEFQRRKNQLSDQRQPISYDKWYTYCKDNFGMHGGKDKIITYNSPSLGKIDKGNMWEFNIIVNSIENMKLTSSIYKFNTYRHSTMQEIFQNFISFLKAQRLVLRIIFGEDIFNNIEHYLPNLNFWYNTFYIHKYKFDENGLRNGSGRLLIPQDKTLNSIKSLLSYHQDLHKINLRICS